MPDGVLARAERPTRTGRPRSAPSAFSRPMPDWNPALPGQLTGWRLVLLLDEFDALLHHPILNSAEFFGGLRSLASRSRGALALVIASRRSLTSLNEATQQFSRTGSPYFNFLSEVTLGALPDKDADELLRRAGDRFTPADRRSIRYVAGGHPYLLQAAASELWEAYQDGEKDLAKRRAQAWQGFLDEAARTIENTWRIWSPEMRRAFLAVALPDLVERLEGHELDVEALARDLRDFGPELRILEKRGFVSEDKGAPYGWRVRPRAFLWWLADQVVRTVRRGIPFEEWLQREEIGTLFKRGERESLGKAFREVGELAKGGASTLIQAAAKVSGAKPAGS